MDSTTHRPRTSRRNSVPNPQQTATSPTHRSRHRQTGASFSSQTVSPTVRLFSLAQAPPRPPSLPSPSPCPHAARPSPSPSVSLQSHLYTSGLLNASLADVHLVAFGGFYRLHRIVLGQSEFFRTLLSGGFAEERTGPRAARGADEGEVIEVEMAQPMTRAAFEFCLARLYGGGPELVPPPWARTSQTHPLSAAFDRLWQGARPREGDDQAEWDELARADVQPATPTFLLSLLAVSTYLEIPSIQTQALSLIHSTITPWTVGQYLAFALGHGLGRNASELELDGPCRGLESVATPWDAGRSRSTTYTPSMSSSFAGSVHPEESYEHDEAGPLFVGPEGVRVGEAVVCWLAKWAGEVLTVEAQLASGSGVVAPAGADLGLAAPPMKVWSSAVGGLPSRWVKGIISSDAFFLSPLSSDHFRPAGAPPLDPSLGPDGEFGRYMFARRVVELRRRDKAALSEAAGKRKPLPGHLSALRRQASTGDSSILSLSGAGQAAGLNSRGTSLYERSVYEQALDGLTLDSEVGMSETDESEADEDRKCGANDSVLNDGGEGEWCDGDEAEYQELFSYGIHYSHLVSMNTEYVAGGPSTNG